MANSRSQFLNDDKPTNSSKGKGLILETPYHPGFVDDKDLETIKMAVDKELADISNAFYRTTEKTADTIKRIDEIKIEGDGILAKIEEVDRVSKEGDKALAERITTLTATVDNNTGMITTESQARADADSAMASQITDLKATTDSGFASVNQEMSVISDKTGKLEGKWGVTVDVNGNISGVELNNGSQGSSFKVLADHFIFTDGVSSIPPFAVSGNTVYMSNVNIRGTLHAEDLQGDLGTEALFVPIPFYSFYQGNVWLRWFGLNIPNARPYERELVIDGSYFYQEKATGYVEDLWVEVRPAGGGFLGQSNILGIAGVPMPIKTWIKVPAGWSGVMEVWVKSGIGTNGGIMQGVTSARMFKASNEAIYIQ